MKKALILLATFAIAAVSCTREMEINNDSSLRDGSVTFYASHELAAEADVKTALNTADGTVTWNAGDKTDLVTDTGVYASDALVAEDEGKSTVNFTYGGVSGTPVMAVYPSGLAPVYSEEKLNVAIPAIQDGTFASAGIEVAKAADGKLAFKNICGMLQLRINNDEVKKIVITSNDTNPLVGTVPVSFDGTKLVLGTPTSTATSITVNVNGSGTYYAAVLPGANLESGFYVELLNSSDVAVGEVLTGNTLTVARRQIRKLNLEDKGVISNKVFFKPDGTGDGSSWDNAGNVTLLDAVLSGASDATLFLAQGEYKIGEIEGIGSRDAASQCIKVSGHSFTLYGGYPADATGTSLSGRNTAAETAISGGDAYRILLVNNASAKIKADGLTFKNAFYAVKNGYGSALVLEKHAGAYFSNCIIKNNQTDTETSAHGGAVRAKYNTTFVNCSFIDNLCNKASGGAIFIPSANSPVLTIDNCTFSGNRAPSGTGGAILAFGGTLIVNNSTFTGSSSGNGGVFRASSSTAITASFSGCTFDGNYSTSAKQNDADGALNGTGTGGAVFSLNGASGKAISLTVEDCEFLNNVAHPSKAALTKSSTLKGAGAIASIGHYADVRVKDCLMRYNYAGFASFIVNSNSTLFLDRCRFWENRGLQDATVIYNNEGKVAVHNSSFQNSANLQTQTDGHDNCYFYNTENGSMLLSCCTFRAASATPVIKGSDSTPDNNTAVINNFLGSTNTTGGIFDADAKYKSHGHNVVTSLDNWAGKDGSTDIDYTATTVNPAKNTTYYCLMASVDGLTFTKATRTDVTTAIGTFDSNNDTGVLTWLGADAVSVDVMKNPRGATEIMPGCYE